MPITKNTTITIYTADDIRAGTMPDRARDRAAEMNCPDPEWVTESLTAGGWGEILRDRYGVDDETLKVEGWMAGSQGAGVSLRFDTVLADFLRLHGESLSAAHRAILLSPEADGYVSLEAAPTRSAHYPGTTAEVAWTWPDLDDERTKTFEDAVEALEGLWKDAVRDIEAEALRDIEGEHEYAATDEAIAEAMEANGWAFEADGTLHHVD